MKMEMDSGAVEAGRDGLSRVAGVSVWFSKDVEGCMGQSRFLAWFNKAPHSGRAAPRTLERLAWSVPNLYHDKALASLVRWKMGRDE